MVKQAKNNNQILTNLKLTEMRTFKTFMAVAMVAVAAMNVDSAFANDYSSKEKKEEARMIRQQQDDFYKKSPKLARKEARQWEREGWKSMNMPIEKQLERTWDRLSLMDEDGNDKYISTEVFATGTNYSAAQMQAENVAKVRIAANICTSVASLADVALANNESTPELTASLSKALENAKLIVSQKLGRVITGISAYRETKSGYEVRMTVLYDQKQAIQLAHQVILQELQNESEVNKKQLENLIGLREIQEQYNNMEFDEEL